jgi:hypothetical protein
MGMGACKHHSITGKGEADEDRGERRLLNKPVTLMFAYVQNMCRIIWKDHGSMLGD